MSDCDFDPDPKQTKRDLTVATGSDQDEVPSGHTLHTSLNSLVCLVTRTLGFWGPVRTKEVSEVLWNPYREVVWV